jgi:rod shape-determining protein MreC
VREIEQYYNYIFQYEKLQAENKELKARIIAMEEDVRSADSLQRENERLHQLLGLTEEHEDWKRVSAYIISWETSNWKGAFTIGKGTNSGIHEGLVAITEYGQVVGLVTAAGPNWATVTTVLDSSLGIGASVASTGYNGEVKGGMASGSEGLLRMNYLPTDSVLRNNDQVLTTGSTVYPRGLIIGYITDAGFDETGVAKYALLRPAADLDNLEQVFIITHYENN